MPIIHLQHPAGALDATRKAALAQRLTDVLLTMEGGAKTHGGLAFASVIFTEVPAGDWWVGGKSDATFVTAPGQFLARVSIPEGYMNQAHKSEVHQGVNDAIVKTMDGPPSAHQGASILVILDEVPEGNWGARGQTISLAGIAETVGLPKDGERFGWVRDYFDAKARQYAAAGYPADAGGLLPDARKP
ncbi:tautomerase family protein [Variovorax sp. J22P271]|uniref:tautomerase family protein n=1 Tax=Variovorax davisae TaxID=3053515 RepID=UPI002577645E|nr:tautomerase family protein [Variovorax sp. J22P271]MDM0032336.1 tautomerase family protein [Variovorax sp. J22P271]